MILSTKMERALNEQIHAEWSSAYLYLAMYCKAQDLKWRGIAHWFFIQSQEENAHAIRLIHYLHQRGGHVTLQVLESPQNDWDTVVEMFRHTCEHEAYVTHRIHALATLAEEEKDFATRQFLNYYIQEQIEEEATADEILTNAQMLDTLPGGLWMLDRELATRTATPPTQE